ncbi:MAG TPA: sortase [Candidatus Saccharimonadales bacterium]|nr:sortase [Candidatus Saccharimonadales bacterium]
MKKQRLFLLSGVGLMIIGLLLALPTIMQYRDSKGVPTLTQSPFTPQTAQAAPSATPPQEPTETYVEGKPTRIQIPSLNIDLPVVDGYYNEQSQKWTLSNNKVHYAVATPQANNRAGNTFLYGHNRKEVFKTLAKVQLGAEVLVTTDNGHVFVYTFKGAYETDPTDGSVFKYQGAPMLTIQTCSGVWYENRQLFTFDLKEIR